MICRSIVSFLVFIKSTTMNSLVALFAVLAVANAGLVAPVVHSVYSSPIATSSVIQGPSSRSTIVGPDGSSISSVQPGGTIIADNHHAGVVSHAAVAAPLAYSAPLVHQTYATHGAPLAYSAPTYGAHAYGAQAYGAYNAYPALSYAASPLAYSAPLAAAYSAPLVTKSVVAPVHSSVDTVIAGPSGTISTSKTVAGGAVVSHEVPTVYAQHAGLYL